ncbi:6898_t:CDS:2, partial [Gigaspora margarita]
GSDSSSAVVYHKNTSIQSTLVFDERKKWQDQEHSVYVDGDRIDMHRMKFEPLIPGAVRISLKTPDNIGTPSYCNGSISCIFWDVNEIQYPPDGAGVAFFTTSATITNYPNRLGCNPLKASSQQDPCFFQPNNNVTILPKSFIAGIENYNIMVEHSVRGKTTAIALRNGLMDGELVSFNGETIRKMTNATRMVENPNADGDIFSIQEILTAAGVNLNSPSTAPGADKVAGETYRSSGIVIIIIIEYQNVPLKTGQLSYKYLPQAIDGSEYKSVEKIYNTTDNSITLVDRHGIRLVFQQHGTIGEFQFIALLTNLVASFALFVSSIIFLCSFSVI